ncbi:MAG TPA: hypothetical protein ENK82_00160 [Campylobacterales bacterium]|nr:hypothetical protein [Campylobacterales bacterium]HHS91734.1 hypothetical protein [Campylobacterales bacterium]
MSYHTISHYSNRLLLDQCEAIIEEGLKTLEKVERAFEIIEEMKLYKKSFEGINAYYKERWAGEIDLEHLCQIQKSNLN